jgi:hypothetical protein
MTKLQETAFNDLKLESAKLKKLNESINYEYEVGNGKGESDWSRNSCVFASHGEAESAGKELLSRWFVVSEYRVVETFKSANYRFNHQTNKAESI